MPDLSSQKPPSRNYWLIRLIAMGIVICAIGVAWLFAWSWGAGQLEQRADLLTQQLLSYGIELECNDREITGFPFRIGVSCATVTSQNIDNGSTAEAGAFRSAAQFYDPGKVVAELDGPAKIENFGNVPVVANWELMHASIRASLETIREVSIEARDIAISDGWAPEDTPAMAMAANAQLHARISETGPEDLDIAFKGTDVYPAGEALASLDLIATMTVDQIVPSIRPGFNLERYIRTYGLAGRIANISILPTNGGRLEVNGPFSLDKNGVLSGRFEIGFADPNAIGEFLTVFMPSATDAIGTIAALASTMGLSSKENPQMRIVTLTVENGNVLAGFVPLGRIEPLI